MPAKAAPKKAAKAEKAKREPSAYNIYMKAELAKVFYSLFFQ